MREEGMRINCVEIIPIDIPWCTPFRISLGVEYPSEFILLKIFTDEGFAGIGSVGGFVPAIRGGHTRESAMALLKKIASEVLLGQNPLNIENILFSCEAMVGGAWSILAPIDYALYDLKGKILNVPVYQLLGGLCREKIALEQIVGLGEPEEQAEMAEKYVKAGFHSIKLHVGSNPRKAIERVKIVREAIGPEIPLALDLSGVFKRVDALRLIEKLTPFEINFVEDPVMPNDVDGMLYVKNKINLPIVADRSAVSILDAYYLIKRMAVDSFHVLLTRIGGLQRALKYTLLVETAGLDYQVCTLGTSIEHAAGAHFAVSRPKMRGFLDELGLLFYLYGGTETKNMEKGKDIVKEISGRVENGYLYPPSGPGLGIELNEEMVDQYLSKNITKLKVG
jgi:L-alanine-DL-glutamate epimerase-like enolase superfamily enzyme